MDKLKPILTHHFWILAFLVLPIAMFGYYSANGALKSATEARETALKGVLNGVSPGNEPNEDFAAKLSEINDFYESSVEEEIIKLWDSQQTRMTWPPRVANALPELFMNGEFDIDTRFIYRDEYKYIMEKLVEYAEPVMPVVEQETVDWKQKVVLAAYLPTGQFDQMSPTSQQMWDAQIDVWLVKLLFDAVRTINRDQDSVTEAVLRRIDRLELFGGSGASEDGGGGGYGGEYAGESEYSDEYSGYGGGYGESYDDGGMMSAMGGMAGGAAGIQSSVSFDPSQEFGSSLDMSGGAAGGGESEYAGDSSYDEGYDSGYGGGYGMAAMGGALNAPQLRYIAEDETAPFLERGFYMSVIILQNKIPDFLVELANSDWPIRVTRFNVGANPYRTEKPLGFFGPGMGMGMGMGMGGYGYPGMAGEGYDGGAYEGDYDEGMGGMAEMMGGAYPGIGGGMGGMYGGLGAARRSAYGAITQGLPDYVNGAMNHPDLVQLDLCGVITMYRQPQSIVEALTAELDPENTDSGADPSAMTDESTVAGESDSGTESAAEPTAGAATSAAPTAEAVPGQPTDTAQPTETTQSTDTAQPPQPAETTQSPDEPIIVE